MPIERNVQAFKADVESLGGYAYAGGEVCSARLANQRISQAVFSLAGTGHKRILDIGCGDGTYTSELAALKPDYVLGIDAAEAAVDLARQRFATQGCFDFQVGSVYDLSLQRGAFDLALVRGVLHHLRDPLRAIAEIVQTAPVIVVVEPNGYNPILKILEKCSEYHRRHEERSFSPRVLTKWFRSCGYAINDGVFVNLVPMFCPDRMALLCKKLEPLVEAIPGFRDICCGQYIFKAEVVRS